MRGRPAAATAVAAGIDVVGPLHGLPLTVKDLFVVDGFPMRAGTQAALPDVGAQPTAVTRLREAGAVVTASTASGRSASAVAGRRLPVAGCRLPVAGCRLPVSGQAPSPARSPSCAASSSGMGLTRGARVTVGTATVEPADSTVWATATTSSTSSSEPLR